MATPQPPKYQTIYSVLREQILSGQLAAGAKLPSQQDLADSFDVTLMTLRQAMAALEADGLVWAARGKGTFVADRPVDINLGNLSSFTQQMRAAGLDMRTELLDVSVVEPGGNPRAATALGVSGPMRRFTRRRSIDGLPISIQDSFLAASVDVLEADGGYAGDSLYDAITAATGWTVAEADESINAVSLAPDQSRLLDAADGHPALLSVRVSFNQHGSPFLYDEAYLVGGRCTIAANRRTDRLSLEYTLDQQPPS